MPALAEAIDDVEARVRAVVPAAHVMYLEPDVHHAWPDAASLVTDATQRGARRTPG